MWVCVMGQITLLMTLCVCVYRMVISVNYRFWAPYTGCQPCFQGLILALAIISWAFAHVQHVGL